MQNIIALAKNILVLLKTCISPHIFMDMHQFFVIKGKRVTGSFPIEVHVTEHCNLNCKGCNHFSSCNCCIAAQIKCFNACFNQIGQRRGISKKEISEWV